MWLLFLADAAAIFVTYSRLPPRELYHVSHGGLAGGASRVLVFSNFPTALAATAVLLVLADRARSRVRAAAAVLGIGLCAAVFYPGVVDQANLDAKPVNAVAAAGVVIALVLSAAEGRPASPGRRPGDGARIGVAAVAAFIALPWIAAELGFFLDGVPVLGRVFVTGKYLRTLPGLPPFPPAVHHGHHHGLDGTLLLLGALLLSRVVPTLRHRALRVLAGAYLALTACYGIGNIANDAWTEQVWKRHWSSWQFPDVLRPSATVAWAVIVLGAAALYAAAAWWSGRVRVPDV
ncbi:MAG TPA: hypothetical protein VE982_06885 [Gaiellaceae bacterium]|nr:hypothetical protein [Gaiellaceae bacterium]